jgi:hypothetical protein
MERGRRLLALAPPSQEGCRLGTYAFLQSHRTCQAGISSILQLEGKFKFRRSHLAGSLGLDLEVLGT